MDSVNADKSDHDVEPRPKAQEESIEIADAETPQEDDAGTPVSREAGNEEGSSTVAEPHETTDEFEQKMFVIIEAGKRAISEALKSCKEEMLQLTSTPVSSAGVRSRATGILLAILQSQVREVKIQQLDEIIEELNSLCERNQERLSRLQSQLRDADRLQPEPRIEE
ncbi:hypothetical protein CLOM_g2449 [Closterium sp. NIES-68]|nr:hypothetical protein CLOM_g2449 [Closterium sp. NIES-68]GJP74365.1 hypothetical protein CLOP_g4957 [Closterium sp. NIES-67]